MKNKEKKVLESLAFSKNILYLCIIIKNIKNKNMEKTVVLEPSTNTHTIKGNVVVTEKLNDMNGLVIEADGIGVVLHGEHGVIVTEEPYIIKLTQQEVNPLTGQMQNAFD